MNPSVKLEQVDFFLERLRQGELVNMDTPWFKQYFQLHILAHYFAEKDLEELIVHSPGHIEVITSREQKVLPFNMDPSLWNWVASYLCLKRGKSFHYNRPFASFMDTLFHTNVRMTFIHQATVPGNYHKAFFRILKKKAFKIEDFTSGDSELLYQLALEKKNILISGATGSGKTSLLKAIFAQLAKSKSHIITIEDTHELQHDYPWATSLVAREHEQYSMEQYLAYAMRMRPSRIILGEIRSAEVIPLILSANSGHKGILATVHGGSAPDALSRLATLFQVYNRQHIAYETIMAMLCHNTDYVIHLEQKQVTQIIKVLGHDEGRPIFCQVDNKGPKALEE